jgi:hypothetical protein
MQRSAESVNAKGRSSWEKMRKHDRCTRGEPLLKEDSLARALRRREKCRPTCTEATRPMTRGPSPTSHSTRVRVSECEEGETATQGANHHASSSLPKAVDTGARAHRSCSMGVGLRVRRSRTAMRGVNRRASSSPPKPAAQSLAWGPGSTSHPP